jgi:hypothetical protein
MLPRGLATCSLDTGAPEGYCLLGCGNEGSDNTCTFGIKDGDGSTSNVLVNLYQTTRRHTQYHSHLRITTAKTSTLEGYLGIPLSSGNSDTVLKFKAAHATLPTFSSPVLTFIGSVSS